MLFTERRASTISGSSRFREFRAFLIHRGGMFARNFMNPLTAEPELDEKSLASRGMVARLLVIRPRTKESFSRSPHPNTICLSLILRS
jgi:hypothetical protein